MTMLATSTCQALLLVLLLVAVGVQHATAAGNVFQITGSFAHRANDYDGDVYAFDEFAGVTQDVVGGQISDGAVRGDGLTIRGTATSETAKARLTLDILATKVTDAPIIFSGYLPRNSIVRVVSTKATMSGQSVLFDLTALQLTNNVTLSVEETTVLWSSVGGDVVRFIDSNLATSIAGHSGMFIVSTEATNAASILHMRNFAMLNIEDNSILAVDYSKCEGCTKAMVFIDQPLTVTKSSVFRVTQCSVSGSEGLVSSALGVTVTDDSVYEVSHDSVSGGSLFNYGTSSGKTFTVDGNSKVSFVDLQGPSTGIDSSAPVPSSVSGNSHVYGGASTIGGSTMSTIAQHTANGFNINTVIDSNGAAVDGTKACSANNCLPESTVSSELLNGVCTCACKSGFARPMCTSAWDPSLNYDDDSDSGSGGNNQCRIPYCSTCDAGNLNLCVNCDPGYILTQSRTCEKRTTTTTTTTKKPTTTTTTKKPTTTTTTKKPTTTTTTTWYPTLTTTTTRSPSGNCDYRSCFLCFPDPRRGCMRCRAGYVHNYYNQCVWPNPWIDAALPAQSVTVAAGLALASVAAMCAL